MKYLAIIGLLILAMTAAACSTPPSDVTKATIGDEARPASASPPADGASPTANAPAASETRAIDPARSSFEFEGYGVGKSHVGTFTGMRGTVTLTDGVITATQGVIDASTVKSDGERLEGHLKSADFFDVATYPEISFSSRSITDTAMVGTLTFHGVTREITIPLTERSNRLVAEFRLSMKEFGIEYTGVNDEVRIAFSVTG